MEGSFKIILVNASIAVVTLFFYSCNQSQGYKDRLVTSGAKMEFINHFPSHLNKQSSKLIFNLHPENNFVSDRIVTIYLEHPINDSVVSYCSKNSIATYHYQDSCNIIPFIFQKDLSFKRALDSERSYNDWLDQIEQCDQVRYPIPNFILVGDEDFANRNGISDDYNIYVLEAKGGIKYSSKYYGKINFMPEGWIHGHSKGVAISPEKQKMIYWFVLW